ncbi:MAG TPA: D-alanyl-D-alanine carboxypeptidase/D-alanyl-D-alanine-endopeptidase, partial [Egibacteraceae bacterium]|nr:D-alanyl-D-alanine carboxypeptidase/D-alanyl-D-alanine-endopeptidase [Egibacteraceae bacterium]
MHTMRARAFLLLVAGLLLGGGLFTLTSQDGQAAPPAVAAATASPPSTTAPAAPPTLAPPPAPEPTAAPAEVAPPPPPSLTQRVDALLADPALAGVAFGIAVRDEAGRPVLERGGAAALLPASTVKQATAAAALGRLGAGFRFTTRVVAPAGPTPDGTLNGDLVLVGSGDPALATETFRGQVSPERPATPLEALADQIAARGIRRITGGVLGDPTVFAHQPLASGWRPRYLEELDATYTSGLTVDAGRKLFVEGGKLRAVASPDPASEAAAALLTALRNRGVQVDGGVATVTAPTQHGLILASVQSPPLDELLRWMVQRSDNHIADALFRTLGATAGDATWTGAEAATRAALAPLGLDWTGVRLADGSGLSRDDRIPADFLAALDAAVMRTPSAERWASWQAVAGESGTLRKRLRGTLAEHRLRGKTGSLEDVRALAGSVSGPVLPRSRCSASVPRSRLRSVPLSPATACQLAQRSADGVR